MFFQCFRAVATYKRYKFLTFENRKKWRKKKSEIFGKFCTLVSKSCFTKFFKIFPKFSKNVEKCRKMPFFRVFSKTEISGGSFRGFPAVATCREENFLSKNPRFWQFWTFFPEISRNLHPPGNPGISGPPGTPFFGCFNSRSGVPRRGKFPRNFPKSEKNRKKTPLFSMFPRWS